MLTTDHEAFLRTIRERPDDDAPRLIYADFLEENGDLDRAELIRVQCDLARLPPTDPRHKALKAREQDLLQEYQVVWKNQLPELPGVAWESFHRGFVEQVRVHDPEKFFGYAGELFDATPIRRMSFERLYPDEARRLAGVPQLAAVRVLDLQEGNYIGNAGLEELAGSPHLAGLLDLNVRANNIGPAGVRALANSRYVRNLTRLDLYRNDLYEEGVRHLAESANMRHLNHLDLDVTLAGPEGTAVLAHSPHLGRLRSLFLRGNGVGDAGARALADSEHLRGLRGLQLTDNGIGDDGAIALANSPILADINIIFLRENRIGDEGARALAASPYLNRVYELWIDENPIGEGQEALRERFGRHLRYWR